MSEICMDLGSNKYTENEINLIKEHENMVYYTWSQLDNEWIKMSYRNELLSVGFEGLCIAAKSYKPELGKFSSYSYIWIRRKMIREIKRINKIYRNIISLDEPIYNQKEMKKEYLRDKIVDETENVEERGISKAYEEGIWEIISKCCDQREIEIFYMYCYDGINFSEIAKRLGVSRQWIAQVVKKAREKILQNGEKYLTE